MKLKVGLAQITPKLGDLEANLERHLQAIEEAAESGVELLVFPELSLTGYRLRDLAFSVAIQPTYKNPIFARLLDASRVMDLVVGFVEADMRQKFFISAAYLAGGEVVAFAPQSVPAHLRHVRRRALLRLGRSVTRLQHPLWPGGHPHLRRFLARQRRLLALARWGRYAHPHLVVPRAWVLATEQKIGSAKWVEHINQAYASMFTNFILHTNRTGFEDGVTFYGGSTIFGPEDNLLNQGPYYEEAIVTARLDLNELRRARIRLPLLRDERVGLTRRELGRILKDK